MTGLVPAADGAAPVSPWAAPLEIARATGMPEDAVTAYLDRLRNRWQKSVRALTSVRDDLVTILGAHSARRTRPASAWTSRSFISYPAAITDCDKGLPADRLGRLGPQGPGHRPAGLAGGRDRARSDLMNRGPWPGNDRSLAFLVPVTHQLSRCVIRRSARHGTGCPIRGLRHCLDYFIRTLNC